MQKRALGKNGLEVSALGLVPYSPLGKGFLTGKMDEKTTFDSSDFRSTLPRFTPEALKANQALVDLLGRIGKKKHATPAQIALAWLLAQKPWIVPIPGTTKLHRLDENIGAAAVELTPDDLRDIDKAASKITVQGARYPEKLEQLTGRQKANIEVSHNHRTPNTNHIKKARLLNGIGLLKLAPQRGRIWARGDYSKPLILLYVKFSLVHKFDSCLGIELESRSKGRS